MVHKPSWFREDEVFVSYAETAGINKDGHDLFVVDPATGRRTEEIDDRLSLDIEKLLLGCTGQTSRWVGREQFTVSVPVYYDERHSAALDELLHDPHLRGFETRTLGELLDSRNIDMRGGHGSPSADMRNSTIPYIKVSDIRAGQVNINPSNLVPESVARRFWNGPNSGVRAFDLVTPIRSSKNIGEFAVIMPGQERIVLTKEVLIIRAAARAPIDNFFLLWALSLKVVRHQWRKVVFMQTNREDVGRRFLEIKIPWPRDEALAAKVSQDFRDYYTGMEQLRTRFVNALAREGHHHVFLGDTAQASSASEEGEEELGAPIYQ